MPKKHIDPEVKTKALEMLKGGTAVRKISQALEIHESTVASWKRKAGLTKERESGRKPGRKPGRPRGVARTKHSLPAALDGYPKWLAAGVKYGYLNRLRVELGEV